MHSFLKIVVIAVIAAVLVPRAILFIRIGRYGRVILNHQPGLCKNIEGIEYGSEDMQVLPNGLVFISSGLKFQKDLTVSPWKDIKGQIFLYNLINDQLTTLTIEGDIDLTNFNPHGISIWQEEEKVTLFVVNHPGGAERVERFSFDQQAPTKLQHEETIISEFLIFPNDILAVGPRQFYFTNYQYFFDHSSILSKLEKMSFMEWGTVGFYDGTTSRIVAGGLSTPNGINISPDGKYVYVANIGDEIRVYERQPDNELQLKQVKSLGTSPDNIDVDRKTGNLWIGSHPIRWMVKAHLEDSSVPAPSQALQLKTKDGLITEMLEVYAEDGTKYIAGSSVAVKFRNKLIIGTITNKAVICDIVYSQ